MDLLDLGRYLGALMLVLGLLGCAALAARRYGIPGIAKGAATRRLSLVETMMIGPRHKLFLLRRDGVEHLVLMGPQGASVVETGIPMPIVSHAGVPAENANSISPQHGPSRQTVEACA